MHDNPDARTPVVPIEYAGKWIAWDSGKTRIIASGATLLEAIKAAESTGEPQPIFAKAPRADVRLGIGKSRSPLPQFRRQLQ